MTGGVPRQVVMEDGVEVALQVDAFTETIGGHEYALREFGECADTVLTLGRSEFAGDTDDFGAARDLAARTKCGGDVLGGLDEAAEDDWLVTVLEKRGDNPDRSGELRIHFAFEAVGDTRHF